MESVTWPPPGLSIVSDIHIFCAIDILDHGIFLFVKQICAGRC